MQTVWGLDNYQNPGKPVYLALGNFDGVHKGHQDLIKSLVQRAHEQGGIALAFIFEPHPAQILTPERAPRLLNTAERKARLLEEMGLDMLIYHPFSREISAWTPLEFVQRILIDQLMVQEVYVGFNYSFGHRGQGTPATLQELGRNLGFLVKVIPPVEYRGEAISSSLVRIALEEGDIITARALLGYLPIVDGVVVVGEHRGRQLGFPTANVGLEPLYHVPGRGVYAAWAVVGGRSYQCVVSIGSKPTFHADYPLAIEAHLMGFNSDIYGQAVSLHFIAKIRDEQRFDSLEELVAQIRHDRDRALEICRAEEQQP